MKFLLRSLFGLRPKPLNGEYHGPERRRVPRHKDPDLDDAKQRLEAIEQSQDRDKTKSVLDDLSRLLHE